MKFKILLLILLPSFLSACMITKDVRLKLTPDLEANSEIIPFKKSGWFFDKTFEIPIGEYSIKSFDSSNRGKNKELIKSKSKRNYIGHLFFGMDLTTKRETYEITSQENFYFDLTEHGDTAVSTDCRIVSLGLNEVTETSSPFSNKANTKEHEKINNVRLICTLVQDEKVTELIANSAYYHLSGNLFFNGKPYLGINPIFERWEIIQRPDGKEIESFTQYGRNTPGLSFDHNNAQIGALVLEVKPKIILKKDLPKKLKELIIAISYALYSASRLEYNFND